jgi:hypothetical protein
VADTDTLTEDSEATIISSPPYIPDHNVHTVSVDVHVPADESHQVEAGQGSESDDGVAGCSQPLSATPSTISSADSDEPVAGPSTGFPAGRHPRCVSNVKLYSYYILILQFIQYFMLMFVVHGVASFQFKLRCIYLLLVLCVLICFA